jgi:hypothetical protein
METGASAPCPACDRQMPGGANFCQHCGAPLAAEAEPDAKILEYVVRKDNRRVIAALLSRPKRCPKCRSKADPVATFKATMKKSFLRKEGEPSRAFWRIADYHGWRCVSCGFEYLVGPGRDREDSEEAHAPPIGDDVVWKGEVPLLRHHRGNCQICDRFEADATCSDCRRRVCSQDFVRKFGLCVKCAPRCDCGRIAPFRCRRCKRTLCGNHRKLWFLFSYCADCKLAVSNRP